MKIKIYKVNEDGERSKNYKILSRVEKIEKDGDDYVIWHELYNTLEHMYIDGKTHELEVNF